MWYMYTLPHAFPIEIGFFSFYSSCILLLCFPGKNDICLYPRVKVIQMYYSILIMWLKNPLLQFWKYIWAVWNPKTWHAIEEPQEHVNNYIPGFRCAIFLSSVKSETETRTDILKCFYEKVRCIFRNFPLLPVLVSLEIGLFKFWKLNAVWSKTWCILGL